jgi:hypothetical protein
MRDIGLIISYILLIVLMLILSSSDAAAGRDRDQKQAKLDAVCEQAREKQLAPMRAQFVEECVQNKEQSDRKACETFYADFGAQSGRRAPLFYDLPECVEAFEYQNSQRQR